MCRKCNQFYANPSLNHLCSVCHKKESQNPDNKGEDKKISLEKTQEIIESKSKEDIPKDVDHSKCKKCDKKLGIRGFKCECYYSFCKNHRMPEDHDCRFDFKQA